MPVDRKDGLIRLFIADIVRILLEEERIESISPSTVWRILDRDALKPWRQHSWIFPRDPLFYERAAPVLDLYHRTWRRKPLRDDEYVISADEKTGLTVLRRLHPSVLVPDGNGLYFSIVQRKALTPVDFASPEQARRQLLAFGDLFRQHATPFQWNYTRSKLRDFLATPPPLITATEPARSRRRAA